MLKLGLFEVSPILGLYRKYHSSRFGLKENTLYIIDGTSLLFNAYFGKANLQSKRNVETSKGVNVNAIAIMVSKLCTFTEEVNCKHMALVFDRPADFGDASGSSEVRKSLLPGYKSNRMKVRICACYFFLFALCCCYEIESIFILERSGGACTISTSSANI